MFKNLTIIILFQVPSSWVIFQVTISFIPPRSKYYCQDHLPNTKSYLESVVTTPYATTNARGFKKISDDFFSNWQFPNCIGSIDGKHFRIMKPPHSGSEFYNYKKYFSLVLQGISDADYKFIAIEVGGKGRQSDGGTYHFFFKLNRLLTSNRFNVPPPQDLPGSNVSLPHVLIGDEAYPLKSYLMRPYPSGNLTIDKKKFNKRLLRARVTIECTFGILSNKWRIFMKSIETNIKHAKLIIKVACVLHNIVRERDGNHDKDFREFMNNFTSSSNNRTTLSRRNNRATLRAMQIRYEYKKYFVKYLDR